MEFRKIKNKVLKLKDNIIGKELALAFLAATAVIVTGLFLGWYNNKVVPVNADVKAHYALEPGNHLSFMANWDGPIYLGLAKSGYKNSSDAAFLPLYPLTIRLVNFVISSPLYSALVVSWAALVGSIYFFIKILKLLFGLKDNLEAIKGSLFFILFPPAVVLLATYTESLFAFLALGAIYFALRKKSIPAALLTMLATAVRIDGVFVLALVALIMFEQKEKWAKTLATSFIGSLGLLGYMTFLLIRFHNPLAFISAQKTNGWLPAGYVSHLPASFNFMDIVVVVLLIAAAVYWWRRRKSLAIYSLLFLTIPLIGGQFEGFDRYAIMAFPFQFMLYGWLRNKKLAYTLMIALFGIFWGYFMIQYAGGYSGT